MNRSTGVYVTSMPNINDDAISRTVLIHYNLYCRAGLDLGTELVVAGHPHPVTVKPVM